MKNKGLKSLVAFLGLVFVFSFPGVLCASNAASDIFSKVPIHFIPNAGQIKDKGIKFYGFSKNANFYFSSGNVLYNFASGSGDQKESARLNFLNANKDPKIEAIKKTEAKFNYFVGSDKKNFASNVPSYLSVIYKNLYKGIDLLYTSKGNKLESEFIVAPKHSAKSIKLKYEGITALNVDNKGNLVVTTPNGSFIEEKPFAFQEIKGKKKIITAKYRLLSKDTYTFSVAKYDSKYPLIIDPTLRFSTFLGSTVIATANEAARGLKIDNSGNVFIVGDADGPDLPLKTNNRSSGTSKDAFVAKFNSSGSLVFTTFVGGTAEELSFGIALDTSGNTYITGSTKSTDFPTTEGAFKTASPSGGGNEDVFVTKLNTNGGIVYSTYLGGSTGDDRGKAIAVNAQNEAYVTGITRSLDFILPSGTKLDSTQDVFVAKLNSSGSNTLYLVSFGGNNGIGGSEANEQSKAIAVDSTQKAYICGFTNSLNFPTREGAYSTSLKGSLDGFITRLNSSGTIEYSSYFGGNGSFDIAFGLALDSLNNVYLTGRTDSSDISAVGANSRNYSGAGSDAYIAKMTLAGGGTSDLIYLSYIGGSSDDFANAIALDSSGNSYITGQTDSTDFPTSGTPYSSVRSGANDAFVSKFDPSSGLGYSTYIGGSLGDIGNAIAFDSSGNFYIAGETFSANFPTVEGSYDTSHNGANDVFLLKFSVAPATPEAFTAASESTTSLRYTWTDKSDNETGFRILDNSNNVVLLVAANTTTTVETNLATNTAYERKIAAYNNDGASTLETIPIVKRYTSIEAVTGATFESFSTSIIIHADKEPSKLSLGSIVFKNITNNTNSNGSTGDPIRTNSWTSSGLEANKKHDFTIQTFNGDNIPTTIYSTFETTGKNKELKPTVSKKGIIVVKPGEDIVLPDLEVENPVDTSDSSVVKSWANEKSAAIKSSTSKTLSTQTISPLGGRYGMSVTLAGFNEEGTYNITAEVKDVKGNVYRLPKDIVVVKVMNITDPEIIDTPLVYPNPYDPLAGDLIISYKINKAADLTYYIYNSNGELQWKSSSFPADPYNEITWNGTNNFGAMVENGVYLLRIFETGSKRLLGKTNFMVLKGKTSNKKSKDILKIAKR